LSLQNLSGNGISETIHREAVPYADSTGPPGTGSVWLGDLLHGRSRPLAIAPSVAFLLAGGYLLFLFYRLARLSISYRGATRLRREANRREMSEMMRAIAKQCSDRLNIEETPILSSSKVAGPQMLGVRRKVILLPEKLFDERSSDLLTSVLGHEMAHVRRRDFLFNLIYEFIYLPVSFHPAAALVKRRIDQTRELACDEIVTEKLVDAPAYALAIVVIAV
jgi:beta-lactamase regulating signal transducer with metallopeptidase domain